MLTVFACAVDYTGDSKWNNLTEAGLLWQASPTNDYMPPNQTLTEGNDDQGFWGMSVMTAAEYNFQNPPEGKPGWLALAQAVFNTQATRWDSANCGGGLRWQIFTWNNGYTYKNTISQACFFNIAARLARYTGNQSYADWAEKTWNWTASVGFMDTNTYYLYDGAHIDNCSDLTPYQWSYNAGAFLLGAAAMYNYTTGSTQAMWRERLDGLLNGTMVFFTGPNKDIMTEVACEPVNLCDLDQQSFKAYLSRWMAATTKWAPWTYDRIKPLLETSAVAAAAQCTGGSNGRMCGLRWTDNGKNDGSTGVGQQMAAMEVVLANMIKDVAAPVTNNTGGTSLGNPSLGGDGGGGNGPGGSNPASYQATYGPITAGDKAGATILTLIFVLAMIVGAIYLSMDETKPKSASQHLADMRYLAVGAAGAAGAVGGAALLRKRRRRDAEKGKASDQSGSDSSSPQLPQHEKDAMVHSYYSPNGEESDQISPSQSRHLSTQSTLMSRPVSYASNDGYAGAAPGDRTSYQAPKRNSLRKKATANAAQRVGLLS